MFEHGWLAWVVFAVVIVGMLALDLGVVHRRSERLGMREAVIWTLVWIATALVFNGWIYVSMGAQPALTFATAYLIEKVLSVDNLFVFLIIFSYFKVPEGLQHRVLFWGILGAIILRGLLITAGITLLDSFHWITYLLGGFLVYTGFKTAFRKDEDIEPWKHPVIGLVYRFARVLPDYRDDRFVVHEGNRWHVTPLFVVLILIELTDVAFALDSVPAVLAISTDPFLVFTSNLFAILGLRALYFVVHEMMRVFQLLQHGVSVILVVVGAEMLLESFMDIPDVLLFSLIVLIMVGSIGGSVMLNRRQQLSSP